MLRSSVVVAAALAGVLCALRSPSVSAASAAAAPCPDLIAHEPVLTYEVLGFGGWPHRTLFLFNDGVATATSAGVASVAQVPIRETQQLLKSLRAAGAPHLCDLVLPLGAMAIPKRTVTLLPGATDGPSHTFSYSYSTGAHTDVENVINAFLAQYFPGF